MKNSIWVKRFPTILQTLFVILFGIYLLKGYELMDAFISAFIWSGITTVIFIASQIYNSSKGRKCGLCSEDEKEDN